MHRHWFPHPQTRPITKQQKNKIGNFFARACVRVAVRMSASSALQIGLRIMYRHWFPHPQARPITKQKKNKIGKFFTRARVRDAVRTSASSALQIGLRIMHRHWFPHPQARPITKQKTNKIGKFFARARFGVAESPPGSIRIASGFQKWPDLAYFARQSHFEFPFKELRRADRSRAVGFEIRALLGTPERFVFFGIWSDAKTGLQKQFAPLQTARKTLRENFI